MLTKFFVKDLDYGTDKNVDIRIIDKNTNKNVHLIGNDTEKRSIEKDSQPSFRTALSPDHPKVPKSALLSPERKYSRGRGLSMSRKSARFAEFDLENLSDEKLLENSPILKEYK